MKNNEDQASGKDCQINKGEGCLLSDPTKILNNILMKTERDSESLEPVFNNRGIITKIKTSDLGLNTNTGQSETDKHYGF